MSHTHAHTPCGSNGHGKMWRAKTTRTTQNAGKEQLAGFSRLLVPGCVCDALLLLPFSCTFKRGGNPFNDDHNRGEQIPLEDRFL